MSYRIESLMSARLFVVPQYAEERIYFLSNLTGHLSLYAMFYGGSVPEPLLPPHIALQNPHLIGGHSFYVFPNLNKILVMIDKDGDENYQPMSISLDGGFPEPAFNNFFASYRVHLGECDRDKGIVYLLTERRDKPLQETYRADLKTGKLTKIAESEWGLGVAAHSENHKQLLMGTGYSVGDSVLYLWSNDKMNLLYGKPIEERKAGEAGPGPYSPDSYPEYFSSQSANIGNQILNPNPADMIYTNDRPYHWGNYTKAGNLQPFYNYGSFYVFSVNQQNAANAAGGSLIPVP
jgi:hypothetical protein